MKRYFWLFAGLTLGWMVFIFCMSAQSIAESKETSGEITLFLAELFYGKGSEITESMMEPVTLLVRKTAHMAAYAILFLLSYGTVYCYKKSFSAKITGLLAYGWTVFYAMTDEVHQIFSGRGALVADVIIDAFGALIGVALLFGAVKFFSAKRIGSKFGWLLATAIGSFAIYILVFVVFHLEVISLFC